MPFICNAVLFSHKEWKHTICIKWTELEMIVLSKNHPDITHQVSHVAGPYSSIDCLVISPWDSHLCFASWCFCWAWPIEGTKEGHKVRWGRRHFHLLVCFVWTHHMLPLPAGIACLQFHPSVVIRSSQVSSHFTAHDSYSFTNNSIMWLVVPSQKFSQVLSSMFRTTDPSEKSPLLSRLRLGSAESLL